MAYLRTVKAASGVMAVQIAHSSGHESKDIEHLGSAHDEDELTALKAAAPQRLAAEQGELDLGLSAAQSAAAGWAVGDHFVAASRLVGRPGERAQDPRIRSCDRRGRGVRGLVLARIAEPTSKLDSARVLEEVGRDALHQIGRLRDAH